MSSQYRMNSPTCSEESNRLAAALREMDKDYASVVSRISTIDLSEDEESLDFIVPRHHSEPLPMTALGQATQAQEKLKRQNSSPDGMEVNKMKRVRQFNLAISACGRNKNWRKAVSLLNEMIEQNIKPSPVSYNAVISACGAGKQWEEALKTFRRMSDAGLQPNLISYSAMMSACTGSGQWLQALQIFDEMLSSTVEPNEVTFTSAIVACGGLKQWKMALACLDNMEQKGLAPNVISYSAAISACQSEPEIALDLLKTMKRRGIRPNLITMNNALSACDPQHWREALRVLDELFECGLTPNSLTHVALKNIFGDSSRAFHLLADYQGQNRDLSIQEHAVPHYEQQHYPEWQNFVPPPPAWPQM
jgi:pentatricopeptide repeat domain-containing protein 1